ncbi:hypothetical protein [Christiangramia sp.]|uniref:hypothetical protein n=1 Tax=Christiangramia sp. TaxID=1931228 RepID=UPI0026229A80|nr:hypothetical protein [Christiangramia sp.]
MRIRIKFLIFGLITFVGCDKVEEKNSVNVKQEIAKLKSSSDQEEYLEYIYESDQDIRDGRSSEIVLKYGKNSSQYQNFVYLIDSIDQLNLKRIDLYLSTFGYPSKDSVSNRALTAPWIVVHHSTDIQERRRFFPLLQNAYENQNINSDQFELYLGRTYQFEFGKYPSTEGAYQITDKINRLIKELNLGK